MTDTVYYMYVLVFGRVKEVGLSYFTQSKQIANGGHIIGRVTVMISVVETNVCSLLL